jgi:hypothetical protein
MLLTKEPSSKRVTQPKSVRSIEQKRSWIMTNDLQLLRLKASLMEVETAFANLRDAMRQVASTFELLAAALHDGPHRPDPACQRFIIKAMAPHWKREAQYIYRQRPGKQGDR